MDALWALGGIVIGMVAGWLMSRQAMWDIRHSNDVLADLLQSSNDRLMAKTFTEYQVASGSDDPCESLVMTDEREAEIEGRRSGI